MFERLAFRFKFRFSLFIIQGECFRNAHFNRLAFSILAWTTGQK